MKIRKRIITLISLFVIIFGMLTPVCATEEIKVGFFAFDGYHNIDDNGHKSGYGYEFIQKVLRYNNYTASYIGYDKNWSQMQTMLENGEIDILTSAQKTPERENKFDFSKSIGTSAAILSIKAGNEKITAGEYSSYNGMRVGVIEGNSRNEAFEEYAKEKGFSYTLVYYSDMDTLSNDLQDGNNIDAIVTSNLRLLNNEWILDKFAASPFYAMVKKGNSKLLDRINYAIDQMDSNSVGWKDVLFDKYYAADSSGGVALSSTERAYLEELKQENKKIKVLTNPDRNPYSYIKDGKVVGIIPDIFKEVAKRTKLDYEFVTCKTRQEYQKLKETGEVDVAIDARSDLSSSEDMGYKLTDAYMSLNYSLLEKTDHSNNIKSVAMLKLSYTSDTNLDVFKKGREVHYYNNMKECINAVYDGTVDATYLYEYSAQKYTVEDTEGILQATTVSGTNDTLCFAVKSSMDYRLLAILNKGVNSVKEDFSDTAINNNTDFSLGKLTIIQTLKRNPMLLIAIVILISVIVILIIFVYQRKKRERIKDEKNHELERFIGYVCKSNSSVMEINFTTNKTKEYYLDDNHVSYRITDYKYSDSSIIQKNILDADFKNIDKEINIKSINRIIENGEDHYFEYRLKEGDEYRWYAATLTGIPRDKEHPNNVIVFKRDINEIKYRDEQTKRSLEDAFELAQKASQAKGSFLSKMSHEIRTPLNAIIGYLSLVQDSDGDFDKMKHYIDNSEVAAKHLLQIINDVLDISSIESGKLKIASDDFDLKKSITDLTTIFYQNAKNKGVRFEANISGLTNEWVIGDNMRLNQVLMNLLSNAVKFTPQDGLVHLKVEQVNEDDDLVYIQFVVSDTGIGMSKEYMKRLFSPFEQEDASTARKYGGTGLGLSISYNLIQLMGGNIEVESNQGTGSTFTVTIHFTKSTKNVVNKLEHVDYSHIRALIVDDEKDEGTYVKQMLKRCGVKSDSVTSGELGLKRLKSRQGTDYSYDLCIVDWNMPNMNGIEMARSIFETYGQNMPIIIATAYDVSQFIDEAKEIGVRKVVSKPLFQSTLFDLLVSTFGQYDPGANVDKKQVVDMKGVHILLAEDNEMNMEIAVTVLEKAGISVDQAVDGQEAYDKFVSGEVGKYDLILMDVQMPILNGYEATQKIRQSSHLEAKTIPIIAMTANAFAEDVAEALSKGMNGHIAKPINYDKLFAVLNKFIVKK